MTPHPKSTTVRLPALPYRPDLDGLRGIAILAVVGFHAFPEYFPGGFVGVDVFFVLSGFLITALIFEQLRRSIFTLWGFYMRRARRLFPALAVVLAACLSWGWFTLLPEEFEYLGKEVAAAAAFVLNFSLAHEGGYFDPAANLKPLLHLWSLSIEEQFYLVWPLALLLLWRRSRHLGILLVGLVAVSLAINLALAQGDSRGDFYFPVSRFWELGFGCLLAFAIEQGSNAIRGSFTTWMLHSRHAWLLSVAHSALPFIGIALIGAAIFRFDNHMAFPGWAALIPVSGALCVIAARPDTWFQRYVMANKALVFIGLISYPLYLWHWPILSFATILGSGNLPAAVRAAAVILSVVLACGVFWFVERPLRARPARRTYPALAGGLLALGIAGFVVHAAAGLDHRFGLDTRAIERGPRVNATCLDIFPGKRNFNYCKSTSLRSPEVIFMGDSRTQAVYDGAVSTLGRGYPLMLLGRGGCPPLLDVRAPGDRHRDECNRTWDGFVQYAQALKPRVVVLVGGGAHYLSRRAVRLEDPDTNVVDPDNDRAFEEGLRDLIAELQQTSLVIYVRELPSFDSAPSCFLRPVKVPWAKCAPVLRRHTVEARLAAYNQIVDEVQREFPDLVVVNSIPAVCGARFCSQQLRSGELLYSDELHLSPAGGRRFAQNSGLSAALIEAMRFGGVHG